MSIATLDYEPARLYMEATNPIEERWRVNACQKEPWTTAFIDSCPSGSTFWDIGACVGSYALIAAHRKLTTVAIEPHANSFAAMFRNLAMNGLLDWCLLVNACLGESTRYDWLHITDSRQGVASHTLGGTRKTTYQRVVVPVWRWDDLAPRLPLLPDRPWYAKVDVDGHELEVLRGGAGVLERLSGAIVEMHDGAEEQITELLVAAGLRLAARHAERDGKPIPHLVYGEFRRA